MKGNTGKAAAWLPFLRSSRMSRHTPIRIAVAATLLSLSVPLVVESAEGKTGSLAYPQEVSQLSVPLVSPQEMTADDRTAAESWQAVIASSAEFFGYTVDSSYTYREIACPVAPHHLLLAYEATSPNGLVSRFTAVIGREARTETGGRPAAAQIIPILHFGLVPFIPAIANPHSIEVFNAAISPAPGATEILAANQAGNQPLLVRGLCYLAMVGEEPAALSSPPSSQATIHAPVPTLVFQNKGKIRQQISIRSKQSSYQVWALTFQSGGSLLTATRQEHPIDRTPLVLNATNGGAPAAFTSKTAIPSSAAQISAQPPTPAAQPPTASAVAIAPPVAQTAPAATPPNPSTAESPAPVAPSVAVVEAEPQHTLPPPSENMAPAAQPLTAPVSAPVASTVEPVAPATPAMAMPPPPPAPVVPTPAPRLAGSTPQPPVPPSAPEVAAVSAPTAITAPPAPSVMFVSPPPVVKPAPPLPAGRFIQNLPQPPSRFIPDSALKTPPHLPQ